MSLKNSVLVVSRILRRFVNILTPNEKYSLSVKASVERNQFKCSYLEITKLLLNLFRLFQNLHKILNTLEKKMCLRDYSFLIL